MAFNGTIHVNQPLSEISVSFLQELDAFVADKACPLVQVKKESDLYYVYDRGSFINDDGMERANGAVAREIDQGFTTSSYQLMEHSGRMLVTDRDRDNQDVGLQLEIEATKILTEKLMIEKENDLGALFNTATFTNALSAAAAQQWSLNTTSSDPLILVNTASIIAWNASGKKPNHGVGGFRQFLFLKSHTSVLDRIKYVQVGIPTEDLLASLFDLKKLYFSRSVDQQRLENKNVPVSPSATLADVDMLLYWLPQSPGLRMPATWYTFHKGGPVIKSYRDEERSGTWVEISQMYQQRIVASQTGVFMSGVIA